MDPRATAILLAARDSLEAVQFGCVLDREKIEASLRKAYAMYREHVASRNVSKPCRCGNAQVHVLFAADHIPACREHPALTRAYVARNALFLLARRKGYPRALTENAARHAGERALYIPSGTSRTIHDFSLEEAWAATRLMIAADPGLFFAEPRYPAALETIEAMLLACERRLDRALDPCPHCRRTFRLDDFESHLWTCEAHPANRLAAKHEQLLLKLIGKESEKVIATVCSTH